MVVLVKSKLDYHEKVKEPEFNGVKLDPIYEAKCIEFIKDNDILWVIGHR